MPDDDLDRARARLDALEARLAAQHDELHALRSQLDHRAGAPRRAHRSRARVISGVVVAIGVAAGGWGLLRRTTAAPPPPVVVARAEPPPEPPPRRPRAERDAVRDPGFELRLVDEERAAALAGRCVRSSPRTIEDLPEDAVVLDFSRCEACDCCVDDGAFPGPRFADRASAGRSARTVACYQCSRGATLARVGARPRGWFEPRPVRRHGAILELARPARMVAVEATGMIRGTGAREPRPSTFAIVARDAGGRPIDAARVVMETPAAAGPLEASRWPSLRVEACPGEAIARVDLLTDGTTDVARMAIVEAR